VQVILLSLFGFPLVFIPLRGTARQCLHALQCVRACAGGAGAGGAGGPGGLEGGGPLEGSLPAARLRARASLLLESLLLMGCAFAAALLLPNLALIFSLTGSTSVVGLVFAYPCAFYIKVGLTTL
jgi:hypothetical protein